MAYLGEGIPKLGFGVMRLPKKDGQIDLEETKRMVDRFLEAGFTYFDTARTYEGSEEAVRRALVERYPRDSYQLATKNAAWVQCKTRQEAWEQFDISLQTTGAGYFDFYLLHNLGGPRTQIFENFGMWELLREKKEAGLIRHAGFSFHGTAAELEAILTDHPETEFIQLQINYADWDDPYVEAGRCFETARRHDVPVIVMEPVKGGMLANPPAPVAEILQKAEPTWSMAAWALRYAADLPGLITVLSGMSSMEQLEENMAIFRQAEPLDEAHRQTLREAQAALRALSLVPCTACQYCAKVCPENIGIAGSFMALNFFTTYNDLQSAKNKLDFQVDKQGKKRASACIGCGSCEEACPQHIAIREALQQVTKTFEEA